MFVPHSFALALLMMITSAVCWGSWANTYKGVKSYRFELFYWDYAVGIFLISLILAFTMGSTGTNDPASFLNNVRAADGSNILSTLVGGAIFNLANLLLVAGIDMAGLAIAFPVSIGIALVVGVVSSYILQPQGHAGMLAAGVVCAVIAVVLDGKAYGHLSNVNRSVSNKSIITCIVSGVLMGLWAPFVTRSMTRGNTLGPYSVGVFLTLGALLSCFLWNIYFMKKPLVGEPVRFGDLFRGPAAGHLLGLVGGCIWGLGTVFNLVAARFSGVAISYAIGQSAPMVAALWGVLVWKEFRGANRQAKTYLTLMFLFYLLAILLVSQANTAM
jgi:glucose uptake protein